MVTPAVDGIDLFKNCGSLYFGMDSQVSKPAPLLPPDSPFATNSKSGG